MDRRAFIRLVGGGVVMAATASCAPTGDDPRSAWNNPGADETDIRRKALSWAILAPNPHNMQPWRVDLTIADQVTLYIDRTRLLPVTDPFNRQITIGCGAFLELLVQALAAYGRTAEVELFPDGEAAPLLDDRPLFRLRLAGAAPRSSSPFQAILKRRTDRTPYTDRPVSPETFDLIARHGTSLVPPPGTVTREEASRLPYAIGGGTVDPQQVDRLRSLVFQGAEIEATTPAAHRESVERTFIGADDVARHPWGISLDQPMMAAMNAVGLLTKEKMATPGTTAFKESLKFLKAAADTAQGFVWIVTEETRRVDEIEAGRAYARANLQATRMGLAMHPWSQGLQEYATQKPVFEALHKEITGGRCRIQMLARIGYPKGDIPPAPRRGLDAQILKA
ncbi:MAG TPA: hypothetical protein PLF78_14030 [Caulobacter sp.]|nr:hypothetical protein [Caulobacter sp.]